MTASPKEVSYYRFISYLGISVIFSHSELRDANTSDFIEPAFLLKFGYVYTRFWTLARHCATGETEFKGYFQYGFG